MTENNILNLPTYEQVEKVKGVVVNTGGMTVDYRDKKFKAVMNEDKITLTGYGDGAMDPIQADFESKFPAVYSKFGIIIATRQRIHLGNNIWLIHGSSSWYIIIDMNNMTCIRSEEVTEAQFDGFTRDNFIETPNHILVRCKTLKAYRAGWAVLDKNTYKFIRHIGFNGNSSTSGWEDWAFASQKLPYRNGSYYFITNSSYNNIWHMNVSFDATGVPSGFGYVRVYGFSADSSSSSVGFAFWITGDSFYVIYSFASQIYNMTKLSINSKDELAHGPKVGITSTVPGVQATWQHELTINGANYILIQFQGMLCMYNVDTMTLQQLIYSGSSWHGCTFDYIGKDRILFQNVNINGERINGVDFESVYEFTRNPGSNVWRSKVCWVPLRSQINGTFGSGTGKGDVWLRRVYFDYYAFYKNGEWYCRMENRYSAKLGQFHVLEGYKEVT